jgi:predicted  nucleic acid-binding Zn-ribbon protein
VVPCRFFLASNRRVSGCLNACSRYYTWVKATEQAQQRARPADLEALLQDKDNKEVEEEGVVSEVREKAPN